MNYKEILNVLNEKGVNSITAIDTEICQKKPNVILRHDIDRRPDIAFEMMKAELLFGLKSTAYIFPIGPGYIYYYSFNVDAFKYFESKGFELGCHIDAKILPEAVVKLNDLKNYFNIRTATYHGASNQFTGMEKHIQINTNLKLDGYLSDANHCFQEDPFSFIKKMKNGKVYQISIHPYHFDFFLEFQVSQSLLTKKKWY